MNKKMYLVQNLWSNEGAFQVDMQSLYLFEKYEDAKKLFEEIKYGIKISNYGWSEKEEEEDFYCEYENGEYLYYHDLVKIIEMSVK